MFNFQSFKVLGLNFFTILCLSVYDFILLIFFVFFSIVAIGYNCILNITTRTTNSVSLKSPSEVDVWWKTLDI